MWQLNLKSVSGKLSMLGIYLLFLTVQLNLKYTFSNHSYAASYSSIADDTSEHGNSEKINATKEGKPVVQKLRLNKRYVHEQAFQVSTAFEEVVIIFSEAPDQIVSNVQKFPTRSLLPSFLRGPPQTTISLI